MSEGCREAEKRRVRAHKIALTRSGALEIQPTTQMGRADTRTIPANGVPRQFHSRRAGP